MLIKYVGGQPTVFLQRWLPAVVIDIRRSSVVTAMKSWLLAHGEKVSTSGSARLTWGTMSLR